MEKIIEYFVISFEYIGSLMVILGGLQGLWYLLRTATFQYKQNFYAKIRTTMGKKLILGLDFFLAGDVLASVNSPNWNTLGMLSVLVVIRTIMTYFILKEIHEEEKLELEKAKA